MRVNEKTLDPRALIDIAFWEKILSDSGFGTFDFSFSDIIPDMRVLGDGTKAIFYTLPEADIVPLAKYAVIVFDSNWQGKLYTFEKGMDRWYLLILLA